ncbi:interleukin-2 receptor subunit beta isoform X2 [Oryzias melastigma]|uniref:interleukin-2 receptor subunit beta isoform X2 n=1 Tax=Oryzias melastigma TaxID=30732 RepID=UPI000CF83201|nr:interleukin-2 receptor subunit beta isoform X2 [Oryzias melastigma]
MRRFAVMVARHLLQLLMVLLLIHATRSQNSPHGLQCTNDYVNNVSCVWSHSGEDCWILGVKKIWDQGNSQLLIQRCKIRKWENSPPGCSFVFEDQLFSGSEVLPRISVKCNDTFVENLTDYKLSHHIKMQRPSAPNVSSSANGTRVWWRLEGRISFMFRSRFKFELQRKKSSESWEKAETNTVTEKELLLPDLSGPWQLRVRVLPFKRKTSQWSDWSPTTSWMGGTETEDTVLKALPEPNAQGLWQDQVFLIVTGATLSSFLIISLILAFCRRKRSVLKVKPVPNPSKYFNTLHSVHKGDLKKWLNPLSLSEAIFTAPLCDLISPVEVCEDWVELPSSSSSSTRGLLSNQSCRSLGSNASGFAYHSSSLSNYCNMGYFMSNSSNASAGTDPNAAYFTFPDNFRPQPFLASASSYESLTKEPNSPDSGIGFIKESEDTNRRHVEVKEDDCSPFLLFVQHPSPRIFTSSMPPALPHPDPATQTSSQSLQEEVAEASAGGGAAAPLASGSVCRSSSMPVETCRSGYLTLKELQATFSNKSI